MSLLIPSSYLQAGLGTCVLLLLGLKLHSYRRGPLPPSPAGWPLIGNMLDIPHEHPGPTYKRWGDELGSDVVSVSAAGQPIVVLNSVKAATDLLDGRSATYSSRPTSTMANELIGWNYIFLFLPYGEPWKTRRRMFVQHFSPRDHSLVRPAAQEFCDKLLVALAKAPGHKLAQTAKTMMGGLSIRLAYGFRVKTSSDTHDASSSSSDDDDEGAVDWHLALSRRTADSVEDVGRPGAYLVDALPALRHVPAWVPGAGFQRKAAAMRVTQREFREVPFAHAVAQLAAGKARPSFVSAALEALGEQGAAAGGGRELVKDVAAQFYLASADSTAYTLLTWAWLMMKHPAVQRRVRAELDAVAGEGEGESAEAAGTGASFAMPEYAWLDGGRTPFLMATIMEAVRLKPTGPMGGAHLLDKDDVYNGFFLPKGSIVMANIWAMFHNEEDYPNPDVFNPDRFMTPDGRGLNPAVRDPLTLLFGFGRRACPGSHIAKAVIWLKAASLARVFEWSEPPAATDKSRYDQPPKEPFGVGFQVPVFEFPCELRVRSEAARRVLASLEEGMAQE